MGNISSAFGPDSPVNKESNKGPKKEEPKREESNNQYFINAKLSMPLIPPNLIIKKKKHRNKSTLSTDKKLDHEFIKYIKYKEKYLMMKNNSN
jgi:hypothetical protein